MVELVTSQEWKEAEERLKSLWSPVKLKCDGYDLALCLERIGQFKNGILVYINGVMKMEWLAEDCEERRRFLRPVKKSVFSQKQKAALRKVSKRVRKENGLPELDASYIEYVPYWTSFRALKSHLIKHNSEIEMAGGETNGED